MIWTVNGEHIIDNVETWKQRFDWDVYEEPPILSWDGELSRIPT